MKEEEHICDFDAGAYLCPACVNEGIKQGKQEAIEDEIKFLKKTIRLHDYKMPEVINQRIKEVEKCQDKNIK